MVTITFTSTRFKVLPHEDEDLNPGILGRSVADWIKQSLSGTRFEVTEDVAEDFGYCLMVHRKPYWLWIGCTGSSDHKYEEGGLDAAVAAAFPVDSIDWTVWVTSEWGLISKLLRRDQRARDKAEILDLLKTKLTELGHVTFK